jgi:hypothetical protein
VAASTKRCYIAKGSGKPEELDAMYLAGDIVGFSVNINTGILTFLRNGKVQGTPFKIPWPLDSEGKPYQVSVSLATDNKVTLLR